MLKHEKNRQGFNKKDILLKHTFIFLLFKFFLILCFDIGLYFFLQIFLFSFYITIE